MLHKSTIDFLKKLKKNNNRDWFGANKKLYEDARYDFEVLIFEIIQKISDYDESISGVEPKDCMFRIYRDVRFSKNKAPYKTNFGASINAGGRKGHEVAGYYVHVSPEECFLGGGLYFPQPERLAGVRNRIAANYKSFRKIVDNKDFVKYFKKLWGDHALKTTPKGFDKEHPAMEFLKLKSFIGGHNVKQEKALSKGFADYTAKVFKPLKPLNDFLNQK